MRPSQERIRPISTPSQPSEELAARYGRTSARSRRDRRWLIIGAAVLVAAIAVWAVWAGTGFVSSPIDVSTGGYSVVNARDTSVTFTVDATPGRSVACAIQAQSEDFSVVGWRVIAYPASSQRSRTFTETVRTTEKPVAGSASACWLT